MELGAQARGAEGTRERRVRGLHGGCFRDLWSTRCCCDEAWSLPKMFLFDRNIELCYD